MTETELGTQTLGKYAIVAALGEGGMGKVYLASAQGPAGFSKLVVVKVLRSNCVRDEQLLEMFLNEARLAARLNHPNVVQTLEVASAPDGHFITMEYLEGQTVSAINLRAAREKSPFPLAMHLEVILQVLAGLGYAHTLEDFDGTPLCIVHRDVSPHNVIVTYDGHVKLLDFGIAKAAVNTVQTETGVLRGKVAYMAPEQACSTDNLDSRADLYSVGVMLWEAIAGQRLRKGMSDIHILQAVVNDPPPSARAVNPDADPELERIALKALARSPDDRYADAVEMQQDLETAMDRLGLRAPSRMLGARVTELFRAERAEMRRVIEAQRGVTAARPSRPSYSDAGLTSSPFSAASAMISPQRSPSVPPGSGPAFATPASHRAPSVPPQVPDVEPAAATSGRSRTLPTVIAVVALVGMVGEFFMFRNRGSGPGATVPPSAMAAAAPTPVPPIAPSPPAATGPAVPSTPSFGLTVRVSPATSRITIDGVAVNDNPHTHRFVSDGTSHRVHADAPGYLPHEQTLELTHDLELAISLEPQRAAPARAGTGRPVPARPTSTPVGQAAANVEPPPPSHSPGEPAAAGKPSPSEPKIDMKDPYAN